MTPSTPRPPILDLLPRSDTSCHRVAARLHDRGEQSIGVMDGLDRAVDEHRLDLAPLGNGCLAFARVERADSELGDALLALLQRRRGLGARAALFERAVVLVAEPVAQLVGAAAAHARPDQDRDEQDGRENGEKDNGGGRLHRRSPGPCALPPLVPDERRARPGVPRLVA
jgi:hypothetical protein